MRIDLFFLPVFALIVLACGAKDSTSALDETAAETMAAPAEKEWVSLFDGTSLTGWHKYGGEAPGSAWKAENGMLSFDPSVKDEAGNTLGGDIVTDQAFANYEFELEWNIGACGNSGIIYNVIERDGLDYPWLSGPEMQILDNSCHPDAKIYKHRAGDLYDMIAGDSTAVKPAGEWNSIRLVVKDGHVEHWMNGQKLVEYANTGEGWADMIAKSKFKDFEFFGNATLGKISLQDHGDPVSFRNIRIREL